MRGSARKRERERESKMTREKVGEKREREKESYPDLADDCKYFITCIDGVDLGTQICNPDTIYTH